MIINSTIHETYYGEGLAEGDETHLRILLDPSKKPRGWVKPIYKLIIGVRVPINGHMVVGTIRKVTYKSQAAMLADWRPGDPEEVIRITFDPDPEPPGRWRGEMVGNWSVRRVKIRTRSAWERLRRKREGI